MRKRDADGAEKGRVPRRREEGGTKEITPRQLQRLSNGVIFVNNVNHCFGLIFLIGQASTTIASTTVLETTRVIVKDEK